jgi:hypothetical protein
MHILFGMLVSRTLHVNVVDEDVAAVLYVDVPVRSVANLPTALVLATD